MHMLKDDSGQFLLLSGIIISLGLVILLIFVSQSSVAGRSSSDSILSFPKNDIRDIRAETIAEVQSIGMGENLNPYTSETNLTRGQHRQDMFNQSFERYATDLTGLMAEKGSVLNVKSVPEVKDQTISNATVSIYYYNGETRYYEKFRVSIG
jgi:hypothetical protein